MRTLSTFGGTTAALVVLGSLVLAPVPGQNSNSGQQAGPETSVDTELGFFSYSGGAVRAKIAKTQTTSTTFPEAVTWASLPLGTLSFAVPLGTTALFNVAFSAECRLIGSVPPNDLVRIRILDNGVPMEPYDGNQAFCSANGYATHKGNWVKRVQGGPHTLQVQFWILDGVPLGVLGAWIDDWTFELVVYT